MRAAALVGGVLLLASAGRARAQEGAAASTFPFEAWNARTAALGGAGTALLGMEASPLNPAAAAGARGTQLSRHLAPSDAEDTHVSVAHGGRWGTLELTFRRRDWGKVAEDLGLDDLGAGEQAVGLGYSLALAGGRVAVGASAARLDTDYLGARSSGWALDAGAQASLGRGVRAGAALVHAGRMEGGEGEEVRLPTQVRTGLAWAGRARGAGLAAAADVALPTTGGGGADLHAGVEAAFDAGPVRLAGRGGWRSLANPYGDGGAERSWSLGAGAEVAGVRLDLAQALGGTLGDETFLTLSVRW
ncbi:MAG TPA: hypothetical protein VF746_08015 [Longimicrobium sp.]